jgi:hypothetical protein
MAFCVPPNQAEKLIAALEKAGTTPPDLMDMPSSDARRAFFEKFVSKEDAAQINLALEKTSLLKDQNAGYMRWYNNIKETVPKTVQRDLLHKIEKLDRVLSPAEEKDFYADLAASKVGTAVTFEEGQKITKLAQKAALERDKATTASAGVSTEFLMAASDLEHYVKSLKPTTVYGSIGRMAAIIARNHLLMNLSTPIKTTAGQLTNSVMDLFTRRMSNRVLSGADPATATALKKEAWEVFRGSKNQFNTASMESYRDTGKLGEKARFDVSEGMLSSNPALRTAEAVVRGYARLTNKIAIDYEHNFTFTKFYQNAFFDGAHIGATNIAKSEGLAGAALKSRTGAIMRDAAKIEPETDVGKLVRVEAQKQAARVTSTNETIMAKMALGVKDAMNKWVPGLGDAMMPIAKIPANIIYNGIENAGIGLPHGAWDIFQGRKKIQSDDLQTRYEGMAQFANGIQRVGRTVGVLAAAAFFSSLFVKRDFRTDGYGNHFFRIGDIWINTEYLNFISPAFAGAMEVKQYGRANDGPEKAIENYGRGALQGLKSAPGVDEISNLVNRVTSGDPFKGITKYAASRGVPAFAHNLANTRPMDRLFFGATGVETQHDVERDRIEKAQRAAQSRRENERYRQ